MTRLIPSEDELHAYVDERLEPVRRAQVQAWLCLLYTSDAADE